jgi:hypothetical protein
MMDNAITIITLMIAAYLILISVLRPSLLVRKSSNGYCWLSEGGGIYLVNLPDTIWLYSVDTVA